MSSSEMSKQPQSITMALAEIVERIFDKSKKRPDGSESDPPIEPPIQATGFVSLQKSALSRGTVIVVWADTEAIGDDVAVNLVRRLMAEHFPAILRISHADEERDAFPIALLASMMECPLERLREARLTDENWEALAKALGRLHDGTLHMLLGTVDSLPDCVKQWRNEIPGALRQLVVFRGLRGQELKAARPSFPTLSPYGRIADLVTGLSEVAKQKGLSILLILENPFRDLMSTDQLLQATKKIPVSDVETCAVEAKSEQAIQITWQDWEGKAVTVYPYRPSCSRIDWDDEV